MKLKKQYPREYRIWKALRARCNAPCNSNQSYQKNGIKCCRRWQSFAHFFEDMGPCPTGFSIDRIDNAKGYEPDNCRWADKFTQANNRGEFTPQFKYGGELHTLKEWSRILKINYSTLRKRIYVMNMSFRDSIAHINLSKKPVLWNGEYFDRKKLCEQHNIPVENFNDRFHKGWSVSRILTTPILKR